MIASTRPAQCQPRRLIHRLLVCLLIASLCSGCTAIHKRLSFLPGVSDPTKTAVRSVRLQADANANQNSAAELDFLFLLDAKLLASLPATSPEWFERRSLLVNNHRAQMLVSSVSLAPGTSNRLEMPRGYREAEDVIVYANYISVRGQQWYRVPNNRNVMVRLTIVDLELSNAGK